ncbi:protein transcription factor [bacterium]|nr:MAG: protein transcription factor [bacterium]
MALHIEDPELVAEILAESEQRKITPEEVVRQALAAKRARIKERYEAIMKVLEEEIWPKIPPELLGKTITKEEEERLLGYGPGEY